MIETKATITFESGRIMLIEDPKIQKAAQEDGSVDLNLKGKIVQDRPD